MTKFILIGATLIAAPLAAQEVTSPTTAPSQSQTMPPADPAQTTPTQTPPSTDTAVAQTLPATDPSASGADQEFATYDKDANGALSRSEFRTWISAHHAAAAPADANAAKKSAGSAFAQADTDRSRSVSKEELTSYLAQPPQS